ncbi:hypothetical protein GGR52DRAFT_224432 [Hypoxylon sp. FL1284]|nr:hypothetical protein GGR52DRAFT_224432 [Hypoxylon sp. FL1284]
MRMTPRRDHGSPDLINVGGRASSVPSPRPQLRFPPHCALSPARPPTSGAKPRIVHSPGSPASSLISQRRSIYLALLGCVCAWLRYSFSLITRHLSVDQLFFFPPFSLCREQLALLVPFSSFLSSWYYSLRHISKTIIPFFQVYLNSLRRFLTPAGRVLLTNLSHWTGLHTLTQSASSSIPLKSSTVPLFPDIRFHVQVIGYSILSYASIICFGQVGRKGELDGYI